MIKVTRGILLALVLIFLSTGCAQKEPEIVERVVYVQEKPYVFVDVDSKGMYLETGSKQLQRMCTPLVIEAGEKYRKVIDLYEEQISEYRRIHDNSGEE